MIAIVSVLGTVVGIVSGFFGGLLDTVIMRLKDILLACPDTVFAIAIVGMIGPGLLNTVIALSFVWSTEVGIVTMLSYAVYGWSWYAMDGEKFSTDKVAVF